MRFTNTLAVLLAFPLLLLPTSMLGQTQKTLYSFTGGADGAYPSGLVADIHFHLYGVTNAGGNTECNSSLSTGCGTVFQLTANSSGWSETVLHVFSQATDGGNPGAPAILDASGNLYGSTQYYGPYSFGALWQLTPTSGTWKENVLHSFTGGRDGFYNSGLTFDAKGHLFGAMFAGGASSDGLIFQLVPTTGGKWNDNILYNFAGGSTDGNAPSAAVTLDLHGDMYGTTYEGGPHLSGTVFEAKRTLTGWTETPIYFFPGLPFGKSPNGTNPTSSVIFDRSGNLYGTTYYGGSAGVGTVYKLSPAGNGTWKQTVLYTFLDGADGGHPGGLLMDAAGNLYGATSGHNTLGSVYKLSPSTGGKWTFTVLYDFQGGLDGATPGGPLVMDSGGNIFGTAEFGGANGLGVVYEITP
jgi:uncharacterized repeat protein (TIGR03803 family)